MTNEQRQQLLQAILSGKEKPQTEVQGYLLGVIGRTSLSLDRANQEIVMAKQIVAQAQQQLRDMQDRAHEVAGAREQAMNDLASLLVEPAPTSTPVPQPPPATPVSEGAPQTQEAGLNADMPSPSQAPAADIETPAKQDATDEPAPSVTTEAPAKKTPARVKVKRIR